MRFFLMLFILSTCSACSPVTRGSGHCPTLAPLLADFVIAGVAMGAGVDRFNAGETGQSLALVGAAAAVALAANVSECR
jgi:hypothetical protein